MPHSIVEHSFSISKPQTASLLLAINQTIAKNEGNFDISQCKARTVFCQNFMVADGKNYQDFIHVAVNIMAGRSLEIRKTLAENLLKLVTNFLQENSLSTNPIALSINIAEMEKEIYQKTVVNTNL
jgi:5-carboxymethyl-2-hydroxymuconate isomerase